MNTNCFNRYSVEFLRTNLFNLHIPVMTDDICRFQCYAYIRRKNEQEFLEWHLHKFVQLIVKNNIRTYPMLRCEFCIRKVKCVSNAKCAEIAVNYLAHSRSSSVELIFSPSCN